MKDKKNIIDNSLVKKSKIINGIKYTEITVNKEKYIITISNLPKEQLIKFKVLINKKDDLSISINNNTYDTYENTYDINYFKNQTKFITDVGIKNTYDLLRFFYTFFQQYPNKYNFSFQNQNNKQILILQLLLLNDKIKINIELNKLYNQNKSQNENNKLISSHSCKDFKIIKKNLKSITENNNDNNNLNNNNIIININNNNINYINNDYLSLIKTFIPILNKISANKLKLIYKSSEEKNYPCFHIKCDNKGPTIILVETIEKRKFICFNTQSWNGINEDSLSKVSWQENNTRDDESMIIDVLNKKKIETRNNVNLKFIQQYLNYGPCYVDGSGFSFKIFGGDKYLNITFIIKTKEDEEYIKKNYGFKKVNFYHIKEYQVYCFNKK